MTNDIGGVIFIKEECGMSGEKKIIPSVYRIDIEKVKNHVNSEEADFKEVASDEVHDCILAYSEEQRRLGTSKSKPYTQKIELINIDDFSIAIYGTDSDRTPHAWKDLFGVTIKDLFVQNLNLAAFISKGDYCYAISAGGGCSLFEQFIDTQFSLEVAKRIMKPEIKSTESREIAGAIYGQVQQYRTSQMIISSQNLGTVWRALKGQVNDEVKNSDDFDLIFDPGKRAVNIEAGSALTIKRSVEINKLLECLDWIGKILDKDPTSQQEEDFKFLNDIKEISARKSADLLSKLKEQLGQDIFDAMKAGAMIDLDFSHKDFLHYQDANTYCFENKNIEPWEDMPPTASEVINALNDSGQFDDCRDGADVASILKNVSFHAINRNTPQDSQSGSVFNHLHGEVAYKGKKYFFIDGKWYEAQSGFMKRLEEDFNDLLAKEEFFPLTPKVSFTPYNHAGEGKYNESYKEKGNWLVADRVFIANVEIADLFHWRDGKLYIIHNKKGFGVTVRDVCSQILHSMNIINRLRSGQSETPLLKQYFDRMEKKYYNSETSIPLSKEEFISLIRNTKSSDIVFVIGYIDTQRVKGDTRSNIAKFESVKLCNMDRRVFDFNLEVIYIPEVSG